MLFGEPNYPPLIFFHALWIMFLHCIFRESILSFKSKLRNTMEILILLVIRLKLIYEEIV